MQEEKNPCGCDLFSEYKDYFESSDELKKEYKLAALGFKESLLQAKLDFIKQIRQLLKENENTAVTEQKTEPAPEKAEKNGKNEKSPEK